MKKYILLFSIIILIFFSIVTISYSYTISGGTLEQQNDVLYTIESMRFVSIANKSNQITIKLNPGASWALRNYVYISSDWSPGRGTYFREIVTHEFSHQIWYMLPTIAKEEWIYLSTINFKNYNNRIWLQKPSENFAENLRVACWTNEFYSNPIPRTDLYIFDKSFMLDWTQKWFYKYTDIPVEDKELIESIYFLKGVFKGFSDNTFRPYEFITKQQLKIIILRWKQIKISLSDYPIYATRKDVRDNIMDLKWKETRWDEPITRSQLIKLIYRAR